MEVQTKELKVCYSPSLTLTRGHFTYVISSIAGQPSLLLTVE